MGFGHRVYRAEDPRARVLRRTARELDAPRVEVAEALEKAALAELQARKPDRVLATNVEFWSAVVLDFADVPPELFTPMFTCARTAGWSAHIMEQKREGRLIRPTAKYVGRAPRPLSDLQRLSPNAAARPPWLVSWPATACPERQLDPEALGDHIDRLYRAAWSLCGSREEAEDLVQETFARVLRKPRVLRSEDDLGYLLRVLRNTFFSHAPHRGAAPADDGAARRPRSGRGPLGAVAAGGARSSPRELYAAISRCPTTSATRSSRSTSSGCPTGRPPRALRVREATITTRLHRARQRVAKALVSETSAPVRALVRVPGGERPHHRRRDSRAREHARVVLALPGDDPAAVQLQRPQRGPVQRRDGRGRQLQGGGLDDRVGDQVSVPLVVDRHGQPAVDVIDPLSDRRPAEARRPVGEVDVLDVLLEPRVRRPWIRDRRLARPALAGLARPPR